MGQKAITLTLRKSDQYLKPHALNTKAFLNAKDYVETLKRSLDKKGVMITNGFFNLDANILKISLEIFYKTQKLKKYRKKFKEKKNSSLKNYKKKKLYAKLKRYRKKNLLEVKKGLKKKLVATKICNLKKKYIKKTNKTIKKREAFSNLIKSLPTNNIIIHSFKTINSFVVNKLVWKMNKLFKYFKRILFSRRLPLYFDFLKVTTLFCSKKVDLKTYSVILGTIFRFLLKRSHTKFFAFLKKLFPFLKNQASIKGIKVKISGKMKGKLRAKPFNLAFGEIGTNDLAADIQFSKIDVHTLYGCFGFKWWIKYKLPNSKKIEKNNLINKKNKTFSNTVMQQIEIK